MKIQLLSRSWIGKTTSFKNEIYWALRNGAFSNLKMLYPLPMTHIKYTLFIFFNPKKTTFSHITSLFLIANTTFAFRSLKLDNCNLIIDSISNKQTNLRCEVLCRIDSSNRKYNSEIYNYLSLSGIHILNILTLKNLLSNRSKLKKLLVVVQPFCEV